MAVAKAQADKAPQRAAGAGALVSMVRAEMQPGALAGPVDRVVAALAVLARVLPALDAAALTVFRRRAAVRVSRLLEAAQEEAQEAALPRLRPIQPAVRVGLHVPTRARLLRPVQLAVPAIRPQQELSITQPDMAAAVVVVQPLEPVALAAQDRRLRVAVVAAVRQFQHRLPALAVLAELGWWLWKSGSDDEAHSSLLCAVAVRGSSDRRAVHGRSADADLYGRPSAQGAQYGGGLRL